MVEVAVSSSVRSYRPAVLHGVRVGLVVALALALRVAGQRQQAERVPDAEPPLAAVRSAIPEARGFTDAVTAGGLRAIVDASGETVGYAAQTSPEADEVIGYRGPSNVLLVMNPQREVVAASLLASRDTPEHVEAILQSPDFFSQFVGLSVGGGASPSVDAVSGATLTSLAIAEAVAVRLGESKPSLRFPEPVQIDTARRWFPDAEALRQPHRLEALREVLDAEGDVLGRLIRTGPLVDDIAGYQGPSEVLLALDPSGQLIGGALRATYDNEPYVDYVRDESYFWERFEGRTLASLAVMDLQAAGVEGVSGATMTSLAVAETIIAAAEQYQDALAREEAARAERRWWRGIRGSWKDLLAYGFVCGAIGIGLSRLRSIRWLRIAWQVALIGGFGLATGNLLSQALLVGWAEQGIAWRLAPGLAVVAGVALLVPPLTKRNLYCHHLCPHGAAQQLVRGRLRWQWSPPPRVAKWLAALPGGLLALAYVLVITSMPVNLAWWEPFDAYLWPVAAWGSVALALSSLALAAVVPMGYCRFGCPTGRLLDYVRRTARSDSLTMRDAVAAALAIFGWVWVTIS